MMDTGPTFALVLLYAVMAGYVVVMLRIFIQILFRAAIEKHQRQKFTEENGGAAYTPRLFVGKRGWANTWLPRKPEINQPAQSGNSTGKLAGAAPIAKQAIVLVSIVIAFGVAWTVAAQQRTGREYSTSTFKQQLLDLELKETRIRMRLEELDASLTPESIERELAGIGSVHPEELREHRRKLLTIERNGLQTQLDQLEEDRARIEAAIATAGTATNVEYAQPSPSLLVVTAPATPTTEMISLRDLRIVEFPLQKLSFAFATWVLLGGGFILVLIIATQKVQQWIASVKSGSSGFQTNRNCYSDLLTPTEAPSLKSTQGAQS